MRNTRGQEDSANLTIVEERRDYSNPLSQGEVQKLQNEAIQKHRKRTGSTEPIGKGALSSGDDLPAVSFVYMIDQNSRSRYYFGQASEGEDENGGGNGANFAPPPKIALENIHSTVKTRLQTVQETNSVVRGSSQLNEPKKNQNLKAKYLAGGTTETVIKPYGRIISAVELYRFGTLYGLRQNLTVIPGIVQFSEVDERWRNKGALAAHHWERNTFDENILLIGHEPHGYHDGEQRSIVQIDAGSDSLEWDYTQPNVERKNKTISKTAKWTWVWNSSKARESTAVFKLGSLVQPSSRPSAGDTITATRTKVNFRKRTSPARQKLVPNSQSIGVG